MAPTRTSRPRRGHSFFWRVIPERCLFRRGASPETFVGQAASFGSSQAADQEDPALYGKRIAHRGIWVEPSLLAEIEYRAKSAEGKVRHPVFKGIREDL
jgi:hypothetical protein